MNYISIQEELHSKPTSSSSLNYLFNLEGHLEKFMTHLSTILRDNNGRAVRSDLNDISRVCASMQREAQNLLNHLQHYY